MAVTELHTFGWLKEQELLPKIKLYLHDEELEKTAKRYDSIDFKSPSHSAELKARRGKDKKGRTILSSTYDDWLIPACKIGAGTSGRECYFYFFEGDNSLWFLWKDEVNWEDIRCEVPWFHTQLHYYVPSNLWHRVEC